MFIKGYLLCIGIPLFINCDKGCATIIQIYFFYKSCNKSIVVEQDALGSGL